jgi:type IV secretory pathway TraG/TraD family ATPase VirD4
VALRPKDRLMHSYVLGPSGVGKSTLLANMALQDIAAGYGTVVIDPKNDLINDLLARIPEQRRDDIILLDAANTRRPVGFNPMRVHGDEHARELAAETTVHILRTIFKDFWGPRTDDILRAALFTLVAVPAPNGAHFTMAEVPELLVNPALRRYVLRSPRLDERWRAYWQEYDAKGEAEQLNMIGSVLNKLRAFTHRTSLRLVLGQSTGIDITEVFTRRKVLLVPLSEGQIGTEAASLLGSLLVGALWHATLQRASIPAERRRPVFAYLDEFQSIVRVSDDLADMLAKARGLGLGLTLAHQYIKQVPEQIRAAVLGTARSQVFFQCDYDDAQLVGKRLSPILTADDLTGLPAYQVAARLAVDGATHAPVTVRTFPLPPAVRDPAVLRRELAERHGVERAEVEAALRARTQPASRTRTGRLGQAPADGGDA